MTMTMPAQSPPTSPRSHVPSRAGTMPSHTSDPSRRHEQALNAYPGSVDLSTSPTLLQNRGSIRSPARIKVDRVDESSVYRSPAPQSYGPGHTAENGHSHPAGTSPNTRYTHSVPHTPIARQHGPGTSHTHTVFEHASQGAGQAEGTRGGKGDQGAGQRIPSGPAVLIPTDRPLDELLGRYMSQGRRRRFRVDSEVQLQGYGLYTSRLWYV